MYSGTTLRTQSGRIVGAHQRIDRVAWRCLAVRLPAGCAFPAIGTILHFEGKHGPDGIKRKSPAQDEPWHFINPTDPTDQSLRRAIDDHYHNLAVGLRAQDMTRAAFEAAWLAHALTDGLTPAHHYPLAEKIEELWGKAHHQRSSLRDKNLIRGHNATDTLRKNWQYWGTGGVFTAHVAFEWGVASAIASARFGNQLLDDQTVAQVRQSGYQALFETSLSQVVALDMYQAFGAHGWTTTLAQQARRQLLPIIIRTVAATWLAATEEAYARPVN